MFSYTKDSNKFFVDTDSEEDESVKEEPLLIFHDKVEHEGPELGEETTDLQQTSYLNMPRQQPSYVQTLRSELRIWTSSF